jgi:AcrR family transcriptional regulator
MDLLAEQPIERIGLAEIAERADVTLAELRGEFGSPLAVLGAHVKELDRKVLADADPGMADEPPRERLFDVLMRRIELLGDHREAVRSLLRSARRDPPLALALNTMAVRSQQWMLTAAGIGASGPKGMVRAQGLALLFANVLRTWVDDDDDNTQTLAALDRELATGQRLAGLLDDLCRIPEAACRFRDRMRSARRERGGRRGRGERAAA